MIQQITQWQSHFVEYFSDYKNRSRAFLLVLFIFIFFLIYEVVIVALTYCQSYKPLFPYIMTLYFGSVTCAFLYFLDRYSFFISYFFSLNKILSVVLFLLVGYFVMNVASWFLTIFLMPLYTVKGVNFDNLSKLYQSGVFDTYFNAKAWHFNGDFIIDPLLLASLLRTTSIAYESNLRQKDLEKDNLRLELDFLRSQINPHFLFNAINNVYSHAERRSEEIPEMILQLSDLLRYILYETSGDFVSLSKDLQFIKQYVAIEQLRHDNHVKINLMIDPTIMRTNYVIPPVLLIMFIENAFKHGIGQALTKAWVNIEIKFDINHWFYFRVTNSKPSIITPPFFLHKKNELGIANVKKRLSILFPKKHRLKIHDELDTFTVTLTIQLNERNT